MPLTTEDPTTATMDHAPPTRRAYKRRAPHEVRLIRTNFVLTFGAANVATGVVLEAPADGREAGRAYRRRIWARSFSCDPIWAHRAVHAVGRQAAVPSSFL
jgi:hypothetical protein